MECGVDIESGGINEKCVSSQKHTSLITKIQVYMFFSSNKRFILFSLAKLQPKLEIGLQFVLK